MHPRETRTRSPIRRYAPESELLLLGPALLCWSLNCVGCRLRLELLLGLLLRLLLLGLVPLGPIEVVVRLPQFGSPACSRWQRPTWKLWGRDGTQGAQLPVGIMTGPRG